MVFADDSLWLPQDDAENALQAVLLCTAVLLCSLLVWVEC
jgi:hypothetical protein